MATEMKQAVLNDVTDILGLPRWTIKRAGIKDGSSLPSHVFRAAAIAVDVKYRSMPDANRRIIEKAGFTYKASYDSTGSTVTLRGLRALREALVVKVRPVPTFKGFVLTYNPGKWTWPADELAAEVDATTEGEIVEGRWSVGGRTGGVDVGDRLFLLQQGSGARGVFASGRARSTVYQDDHFNRPGDVGNYVDVDWETILPPDDLLPVADLREAVPITHDWSPQGSGTALPEDSLAALEVLWRTYLEGRYKAWQKGDKTFGRGQAQVRDSKRRKAIEDAAQGWLMKVYEDAGWCVEDTHIGNPFDARATKGSEVVYLEAKGTQSPGATVIVTRREISHALEHPGQCVIGIWSGMRLDKNNKVDPASGTKSLRTWTPAPQDLDPISYDWTVGGAAVTP